MFVTTVPNRGSPPAVLLRESYREDGRVKSRTLANLSGWTDEKVQTLRAALRGDKLVPAGEGGFEIRLKVVPGANRSEVVGPLGDRLKVRVAAPAEGGKANRAVVRLLREWLPARRVTIVFGHGSAEKIARAEGLR